MTPFSTQEIPREDQDLFWEVRRRVEALPDLDLGLDSKGEKIFLSCHMLARAVAKAFKDEELRCCDGLYLKRFQHSWNVTRNGNIIDVYPVAEIGGPIILGGPLLLDAGAFGFTTDLYRPFEATALKEQFRHFECLDQLWFSSGVELITRHLSRALAVA